MQFWLWKFTIILFSTFTATLAPVIVFASSDIDWDPTRAISRGVYNHLFGECHQPEAGSPGACSGFVPPLAQATAAVHKSAGSASRSRFFKEVAKSQIDESHCDFHYISSLDHNGDNDWDRACTRAKHADKFSKSIETVMRRFNDPMPNDPNVTERQKLVLNDVADKIILLRNLRWEDAALDHNNKLDRCRHDERWDDVYCPKYEKQRSELREQENKTWGSIWNGQNPVMQRYVNSFLNQKEFKKENFLANALEAQTLGSFQKQVIEPMKDKICADNSFYKKQESSGDLAVDAGNLNAEDKTRLQNYKKLLTLSGFSRMESDPAFKQKYEGLRCQLDVEYGNKRSTIEGWEQGAMYATMLVPVLGEVVGTVAVLSDTTRAIIGVTSLAGLGIDSYVNLKQSCLGGDVHATLRSAICSAGQKPLDPHQQLELINHDMEQGNCALAVVAELTKARGLIQFLKARNAAAVNKIESELADSTAERPTMSTKPTAKIDQPTVAVVTSHVKEGAVGTAVDVKEPSLRQRGIKKPKRLKKVVVRKPLPFVQEVPIDPASDKAAIANYIQEKRAFDSADKTEVEFLAHGEDTAVWKINHGDDKAVVRVPLRGRNHKKTPSDDILLNELRLREKYGGPKVYGPVTVDGQPGVAVEWVNGKTLAQGGKLTPKICARIEQILTETRKKGLFLSDVDPTNVMITPYGKVVLVDIPLRRAGIGITYAKAREVVDQRWRSLLKNYGGAQCGY